MTIVTFLNRFRIYNKHTMKQSDYIKACRKGSRNAELENSTGFNSVHKVHKSVKNYSRKIKHKNVTFID